jgi:hypothetical protein
MLSSKLYSQTIIVTEKTRVYEIELDKSYILHYRANIRKEPNRDSDVIAVLSLNDKIEILENTKLKEEINGFLAFWYKIKCGNIVGYTFGGNIAAEAYITDIDNNGINDYFYIRISQQIYIINPFGPDGGRWGYYDDIIDSYKDIIIYINNRKINSNQLHGENNIHIYNKFNLYSYGDDFFIELIDRFDPLRVFIDSFSINQNGIIEYEGRGELDR